MINESKRFTEQAIPVGNLAQSINKGYWEAYERDRKTNGSEWGLDLKPVAIDNGVWKTDEDGKGGVQQVQDHVLHHTISQVVDSCEEIRSFFEDREDDKAEHFREAYHDMSNAWRAEFALNDPIGGTHADRMKTSEWRITKCYYAVYLGTSGLLKSKYSSPGQHSRLFKTLREEVLETLSTNLFAYPFLPFPADVSKYNGDGFQWPNPFPTDDISGKTPLQDSYATKSLREIFTHTKRVDGFDYNKTFTFYDVLFTLRKWANYNHGSVFSRLYGKWYSRALDQALRLLAFTGLVIAETGLISSFGFGSFENMHRNYAGSCDAGIREAAKLIDQRMDVYKQAFR